MRGPKLEAPSKSSAMGHGPNINVENSVPDVLSEGLLIIFHLAATAKAWKVNLKSVVLCSPVHIYIYISNMYANWNELDG